MINHPDDLRPVNDGRFGLLDTIDNVWMGTIEGPLRYDNRDAARFAAAILAQRLEWPRSRILAMPFHARPPFVKRDELTPTKDAVTAIEEIESEAIPTGGPIVRRVD